MTWLVGLMDEGLNGGVRVCLNRLEENQIDI